MAARYSFYYAAVFLAIGIHVPFWPAWLAHRGLDAGEISLILSVAIWVRAFANPFIAHFADRSGAHRRIVAISAAGSVGAYALLGAADGFPALFGLNLLATSLFMALIPLGENLASRSAATHGFDYGRVRLWGSIAFVAAAWIGGFAIDFAGDGAILWMLLAALTCAAVAGSRLPRPRRRGAPANPVSGSRPAAQQDFSGLHPRREPPPGESRRALPVLHPPLAVGRPAGFGDRRAVGGRRWPPRSFCSRSRARRRRASDRCA